MNKDILPVWALLTVSLLIVIVISCFDGVDLGGFRLKSSGIADRLTRVPDTAATAVASDSSSAMMPQTFPAPLDTASQNILIIGDSMLEGLNPRLAAYADENGHKLNSVIWYSSTSKYWGTCDTLKVFLKRFKPTFIIISLGGNELFVRNIAEERDQYVKNFLSQIGDIPYLWIGPPNWKKDTGINELIAKNVKPGCFFLSDGMHFEREKDGAHPTHASAALWLDSVARWMPAHAAHPIKMKKPSVYKSRPASVTVLQPLR